MNDLIEDDPMPQMGTVMVKLNLHELNPDGPIKGTMNPGDRVEIIGRIRGKQVKWWANVRHHRLGTGWAEELGKDGRCIRIDVPETEPEPSPAPDRRDEFSMWPIWLTVVVVVAVAFFSWLASI